MKVKNVTQKYNTPTKKHIIKPCVQFICLFYAVLEGLMSYLSVKAL